MTEANATIQLIAVIASVAGLLGWVIHTIVKHFIAKDKQSMDWIKGLVDSNQKNTTAFVDTINHQRTKDREMQERQVDAIRDLTQEIKVSNQGTQQLIAWLKNGNNNNA